MLVRRPDARFHDSDGLQVVAPARFRDFAIKQGALHLLKEDVLFGDVARAPADKAREASTLAEHQPAMKNMQRRPFARVALVELLPALEEFVPARFIRGAVEASRA